MQKCGVQADLMTFGVLALGCQKKEDGEKLIESAREAGFRYTYVKKKLKKNQTVYLPST